MNAVLFSLLSLRRRTYLIVKDHRAIGAQARYGGQCILRGRCGMGVDNGVETRSDEDTKDGRGGFTTKDTKAREGGGERRNRRWRRWAQMIFQHARRQTGATTIFYRRDAEDAENDGVNLSRPDIG